MRLQKGKEKKTEKAGLHGEPWRWLTVHFRGLIQKCKVPCSFVCCKKKKKDKYSTIGLRIARKALFRGGKKAEAEWKMLKEPEKHGPHKIQIYDQQSLSLTRSLKRLENYPPTRAAWLQWTEGGDRSPPYCFAPVRFIKIRGHEGGAGAVEPPSAAQELTNVMMMMWNGSEARRDENWPWPLCGGRADPWGEEDQSRRASRPDTPVW